jgi:hypothetical protein
MDPATMAFLKSAGQCCARSEMAAMEAWMRTGLKRGATTRPLDSGQASPPPAAPSPDDEAQDDLPEEHGQ